LDVHLDKRQDIGVVYSGSYDDWIKKAGGPNDIRDADGKLLASLHNTILSKEPYANNAYNLNYTFNIDSAGTLLTADADYVSYRNKSDGYLGNTLAGANGDVLSPYRQLNIHQPSYIDIRSVKTDLVLPIKLVRVRAGLKYSSVNIDNNFRYDSLVKGIPHFDSSLSNYFIYKEKIAAAYLSAARQWKHTGIEAGLRLEHTYSDGNAINTHTKEERRYTNLFPSLSIDQDINANGKLNLSVSRRINRPGYSNLNPVRYFSDQYSYYEGNPNLVPEKAWIASLSYTLLNKYIATFTYTRFNKFIAETAFVNDSSGVLVTSNANYPHKDRAELLLVAPFSFTSWWSVNPMATISYTSYPLILAADSSGVQKLTADLTLAQTFRLPGRGLLEILARYTSPNPNGIYLNRHYFSVDGGYKLSVLPGKLDGRLSFSDLFHTIRWAANSTSATIQSHYYNIPDSRRFRLTAIYHLGGKLTGTKARMLEEKQRL
jgi:hypothetical protein